MNTVNFDNFPIMLAALDSKLLCRQLSQRWRAYLSVNDGEPFASPLVRPLADLVAADEVDGLSADLNALLERGQPLVDRPVTLRKRERGIELIGHGLVSAWLSQFEGEAPTLMLSATCTDELDRVLTELHQLESAHQLILDAAGEGIYGLDADGTTTFGNAASKQILGWDPTEIIGKPAHDVHHHSHADGRPYPRTDCPIYAALQDGEVHRVDHEVFWHTDGRAIPVEYTSTPIFRDGKIDGAVVVFRDISERREMERQREQAYEEIRELKEQLEVERDYLRDEINLSVNHGEMIGDSPALHKALGKIEAVANTLANVLILGESGVGKEMVARAIHAASDRADRALVKVNCASIPRELFESEFFGHVKGAFTGAHRDRVGRFQMASGGTLFLDEVGEIPLDQQVKLLRSLQEHEFERVGDDQTISVDVRVVAATNRDLMAEVRAGRFREDLFYRLSVFPIDVPPLRERLEDIMPLAQHFLEQSCRELGRELGRGRPAISKQQSQWLRQHDWPGNVRELKNVIERAIILTTGKRLRLDLAMPNVKQQPTQAVDSEQSDQHPGVMTDAELRATERANLVAALAYCDGRVWGEDGAAALLGIKPSTLTYRMKRFGINKD